MQMSADQCFSLESISEQNIPAVTKWIAGILAYLRRVAVPVRTSLDHIGEAIVLCARTRPKYIGGPRAIYREL